MKIIQCWDDGVEDDIRLCEILRTHHAKASFNLNPGLHKATRSFSWRYKDCKDVRHLALGELCSVYAGFTIANHTVTHPKPLEIPLDEWRAEVVDGRMQLQDIFQQPVYGFAYPYGDHDAATSAVVAEAGHIYGRTCENATPCHPAGDPFRQPTDCHHAAPDFWDRYEQAKSTGAEVFYFWGHSYEFITEQDWIVYTEKLLRINADPDAVWADLPGIFSGRECCR